MKGPAATSVHALHVWSKRDLSRSRSGEDAVERDDGRGTYHSTPRIPSAVRWIRSHPVHAFFAARRGRERSQEA
jgi:hypothetical protein